MSFLGSPVTPQRKLNLTQKERRTTIAEDCGWNDRGVEPRRFYVLFADIEAHGHTEGRPFCAALASNGRAAKPHNDDVENESEQLLREL